MNAIEEPIARRSLLFQKEMILALLNTKPGVWPAEPIDPRQPFKWQTRRIVKPQPVPFGESSFGGTRQGWIWKPDTLNRSWNDDDRDPYRNKSRATCALSCESPYGREGEFIWVREGWATSVACDKRPPSDMEKPGRGYGWPVWYPADGFARGRPTIAGGPGFTTKGRGRQSIHMPRWASRITLKLMAVRVEQIQQIGIADCIAEGVAWGNYKRDSRDLFHSLWDRINADDGFGWDANPFIWVLEVQRIK